MAFIMYERVKVNAFGTDDLWACILSNRHTYYLVEVLFEENVYRIARKEDEIWRLER